MSDYEEIAETPVKEKKPRTEAQIAATQRMLEKRKEIDAIKRGHREALKTEKELKLQDKVNKIKEVESKLSQYQSDDNFSNDEEKVIVKPKPKPKTKPKKKIIYQEESESEEEEVIIVKKPKKKRDIAPPRKRIVYQQEESDDEEPARPPPKQSLPNQIQRTSREQLQHDLHTERIQSALRSLGYLA
jgi:hypothetical protein